MCYLDELEVGIVTMILIYWTFIVGNLPHEMWSVVQKNHAGSTLRNAFIKFGKDILSIRKNIIN